MEISRYVNINPKQLRKFRNARGWSQVELARRAGYSDRLIRKAETGGSLEYETAENLAEALSEHGGHVSLQSLINDNLAMTRHFMECYDAKGRDMIPEVEHFLADDMVMNVAGDKSTAPFAGQWHGKDGLQQFLDSFFAVFQREPNSLKVDYLVGDSSVTARYKERNCFLGGQLIPPVWVNLHFQFCEAVICRIDDEFDTGAINRFRLEFNNPRK